MSREVAKGFKKKRLDLIQRQVFGTDLPAPFLITEQPAGQSEGDSGGNAR